MKILLYIPKITHRQGRYIVNQLLTDNLLLEFANNLLLEFANMNTQFFIKCNANLISIHRT